MVETLCYQWHMKLEKYLEIRDLSKAEFAKMIGVTRQSVYRYINGRPPEWDILREITAKTDGAVQANDWVDG